MPHPYLVLLLYLFQVLSKALSTLYEDKVVDRDGFYKIVDCLVLNPKSITAGELYGEFNLQTNEWKDGIVPKLVRDCVDALNEVHDACQTPRSNP